MEAPAIKYSSRSDDMVRECARVKPKERLTFKECTQIKRREREREREKERERKRQRERDRERELIWNLSSSHYRSVIQPRGESHKGL